jgi:lysine-N-methylase
MAPEVQNHQASPGPVTRAPLPLTWPELATLAMQRFHCVGEACGDTCCRDFGIALDKESRERMRIAAQRSHAGQRRVVRLPVLTPPSDGESLVALDEHGACPMLESSGRCELHRKYGEPALGTACSVFPRTVLKVREHFEISGSLACPELARLTLLSDDGVEQSESPTVLLPRDYVGKTIPDCDEKAAPYVGNFLAVRAALREAFTLGTFPLSSRLVFAAHFAAQVHDFFHAGTTAFSGKKHRFAQRRLAMEIALSQDEVVRDQLHRELMEFSGNDHAVLGNILSLLRERLRLPHPPRFAAAVGTLTSVTVATLRDRDAVVSARWPGFVDQVLARYARHFLLRTPYTEAPDLLAYLGRMALCLGAIKTMALASPVVDRLMRDAGPANDDGIALVRALADCAQIFTKAVSHHASFLSVFHQAFESGQGTTFGRLVLFASYLR